MVFGLHALAIAEYVLYQHHALGWACTALKQFIFLDNFIRFFNDKNISIALRNTGIHLLVGILGVIPLCFYARLLPQPA